jgi:hypothetical protein
VTLEQLRERRALVLAERNKTEDSEVIARCDQELSMIDLEIYCQTTYLAWGTA